MPSPSPGHSSGHSPRSTLDTLQRLFYAAREGAAAGTTRFVAAMNGDTLKELGREVAMGGSMPRPTCRRPAKRPRPAPWHALRTNGIDDKVYGYGSLLAKF